MGRMRLSDMAAVLLQLVLLQLLQLSAVKMGEAEGLRPSRAAASRGAKDLKAETRLKKRTLPQFKIQTSLHSPPLHLRYVSDPPFRYVTVFQNATVYRKAIQLLQFAAMAPPPPHLLRNPPGIKNRVAVNSIRAPFSWRAKTKT
jgi:hypothetical protein